MTSRKRRDWTAEEKLSILEEARQRLQTISGVCRQQGIATGQFYAWEKEARRGALEALRARKRGCKSRDQEAQLKMEITRLWTVVVEPPPASKPLRRPPELGHPDQVRHVDLMYLCMEMLRNCRTCHFGGILSGVGHPAARLQLGSRFRHSYLADIPDHAGIGIAAAEALSRSGVSGGRCKLNLGSSVGGRSMMWALRSSTPAEIPGP